MATLHPAIEQANILGYKDGETLNIRALAGKGFDVQADRLYPFDGYLTVGTWEFTRLESQKNGGGVKAVYPKGLEYLSKQNDKGYGIYLIPNKGGRKDGEISHVTALYYECDDIGKNEQWERIERLPIQPSMVVETRNSLHVYYGLAENSPENWRNDQQRLIQLMESDHAIHNESRLMRLAGFNHQKKGEKPFPITIVFKSTKQYLREEIRGHLPGWDAQVWSDYKKEYDPEEVEKKLKELRLRKEFIGTETFPLEICLTRKDRDLIANGTSAGTIYTEGFKLACNLIATEEWLRLSGYTFSGTAETLFVEFAIRSNSTKPINHPAFQHALKVNPSPSLPPEAIEKCVTAWRYKQAKLGDQAQQKAYEEGFRKRQESNSINNVFDRIANFLKSAWKGHKANIFKNTGNNVTEIPEKEDYQGEIVKFKQGEAPRLYEKAGRLGYKYVLDISPTGSGKTFTVGQLTPSQFFVFPEGETNTFARIFYSTQSTRNPNSAVIEDEYYEQAVRSLGYILDFAKKTPGGRPFRHQWNPEHELTEFQHKTAANCHKTPLFLEAYANGHSTKGFCGACEFHDKCKTSEGEGWGYHYTARDFIDEQKVRSHLKAIPIDIADDRTIIVLDESEAAEWVSSRLISERHVNWLKKYFKKHNKELYDCLVPFFDSLLELFDEHNNPSPPFGWIQKDLIEMLEIPEGIVDWLEAIRLLEEQSRPTPEELDKGVKMNPVFLHPLLSILLGKRRGSISAGNVGLTLTLVNERALELFKKTHINIFQDATHTRQQLAMNLGIDESEILVLCQESEQVKNLHIKQYTGAGRLGNNRSQDEQRRAELWREHLNDTLEDVGYIDHKKYANPGDLIHGGDGRGSNAFLSKKNVVSMGVYSPNMGAILNEYQALSGKTADYECPEFKEYYGHKVASNVLQEIGRLRANRRPDEELTYHIIADCDLSFLEDLGYEIERIEATTINPEFGTIENRTKARNIDKAIAFVKEFGEEAWGKLTQQKFADIVGVSQSAIGHWVKKYIGKFSQFKELIMTLINPKPKPDSAYSEQDKEEIEATGFVISMVANLKCSDREFSEQIQSVVSVFKWRNVLEAINRLGYYVGLRLLFRVLRVCRSESEKVGKSMSIHFCKLTTA